jgi:hypothetical protein
VPDSFTELRLVPPSTSALVWLGAVHPAALHDRLAAFDAAWAVPLERALDTSKLSLRLVITRSDVALSFSPRASGAMQRLRRRWSPPPNLQALLAAHAELDRPFAKSNA